MEQFRQIGEVLGSIRAQMMFRDEIRINQRQCSLLVDAFSLAFEGVADEIRHNLSFEERLTKWKALEHPLKELHRIFREGEQYIRQCLETRDWWAKAVSLTFSTDCIEFHMHNLLWCIPVVLEAIENAGEISGYDDEEVAKKNKLLFSKKYEKDWMEPKLFQYKFGRLHLVSQEMCNRMDTVWKEDRWILSEKIAQKRSSGSNHSLTKQENRLAELLDSPKGRLFPCSVLVGWQDYQVRRRLGSGSNYKEIQWMGESFVAKHFIGDTEPVKQEISLLSSVSHPNVMHCLYAFCDEDKKECFQIMELMSKDLSSYIKETCSPKRRVPFSLTVAVDIMLQIARGMEYLHSCKIYHGELNPSNILVRARSSSPDGYLHVKVANFGFSPMTNSKALTNQGGNSNSKSATHQATNTDPCIWYAPEVLSEQEQSPYSTYSKCTEKADVYSFAMICFELLTGKIPFEDGHLQGDKMSKNIRAGERPLFPFPSPKYLTNLTKRCWQSDPLQRPSFSSICRMLRYIKRFLIMNPDHSQPDPPIPPIDYFDLEMSLAKKFTSWGRKETTQVSEIPFQMYAYRVIERERTSSNLKEKSSESGSEGTSICGDESTINIMISEDSSSTTLSSSRSSSQTSIDSSKKGSTNKADGNAKKQTGQNQKPKTVRPPQKTSCGRSLWTKPENQLQQVVANSGRRRASGHASDTEIA